MVGHPGPVPFVGRDADTGHLEEGAPQLIGQVATNGIGGCQCGVGTVRRGDEVATGHLGQRLQQRDGQILTQPRHLPVESVVLDLVENVQRDVNRDTIGGCSRLELVSHPKCDAVLFPNLRVVLGADRIRVVLDQEVLGEGEQVRRSMAHLLPPRVEVLRRDDLGRQQRVVEVDQCLVLDKDVTAPGSGFKLGQARDQRPVVVEEPMMRVPVTFDQSMANEQISRLLGVDARVAHLASGNQRHAIEGDLLQSHGRAPLLLPVRFAVAALDQVLRKAFDLRRVCSRVDACPQPRGLDELSRHDPLRLLLEQRGTR